MTATMEDGPWQGWAPWHARGNSRFVDGLGDVYFRAALDGDGPPQVLTAIDTAERHGNALGFLHGGFLMGFIDVAMFAVARVQASSMGAVTLQCSTDFIGSGTIGKRLEGRGRLVRETGRLMWVAGTLTQDDGAHLVCQWHGMLRKVPA